MDRYSNKGNIIDACISIPMFFAIEIKRDNKCEVEEFLRGTNLPYKNYKVDYSWKHGHSCFSRATVGSYELSIGDWLTWDGYKIGAIDKDYFAKNYSKVYFDDFLVEKCDKKSIKWTGKNLEEESSSIIYNGNNLCEVLTFISSADNFKKYSLVNQCGYEFPTQIVINTKYNKGFCIPVGSRVYKICGNIINISPVKTETKDPYKEAVKYLFNEKMMENVTITSELEEILFAFLKEDKNVC